MRLQKNIRIFVSPEARKSLARMFRTSEQTIFTSLAYTLNTELAIAIRKQAFEKFNAQIRVDLVEKMQEDDALAPPVLNPKSLKNIIVRGV